jgi:hypothetical protein
MLDFIERNFVEVLVFTFFFGVIFTVTAGYVAAQIIFG